MYGHPSLVAAQAEALRPPAAAPQTPTEPPNPDRDIEAMLMVYYEDRFCCEDV